MDDNDFNIIASLLANPFETHEGVGRKVGLTGTRVKARLSKLEARGVLRGFRCLPAPSLFGRRGYMSVFENVPYQPELVSEAMKLDTVVAATLHNNTSLVMMTYDTQGTIAPPEAFASRLGAPSRVVTPQFWKTPKSPPTLSPVDWRTMRPLVANPRIPLNKLAAETGLTPRTVRRHREKLVKEGLLYVAPLIAPGHARGSVVFELVVYLKSRSDRAVLRKLLPGSAVIDVVDNPPGFILLCWAYTVGEALETAEQLRGDSAVSYVGLSLTMHREIATDRLDRWIEIELNRWKRRDEDS